MLLKLAALGALGYAGYRYYDKTMNERREGSEPDVSDPHVAMAGGPLSEEAMVVEGRQPSPAT
jgi:hypothetical protein